MCCAWVYCCASCMGDFCSEQARKKDLEFFFTINLCNSWDFSVEEKKSDKKDLGVTAQHGLWFLLVLLNFSLAEV